MTKTVYPDSGEVVVAYNDDGTVHTRTDQRDWTVTTTYDDAKRATQESVAGNGLVGTTTVTYAYGRPGPSPALAAPSAGGVTAERTCMFEAKRVANLPVQWEGACACASWPFLLVPYVLGGLP